MEKTTKKVRPKSVAARPKKEAAATRKSTFAIIFVLQKGKAREDGTAPIMARITVNHEMVHFATRMYIHPDRWLPKDYRTAGKSREEKQINDALDELRVLIRRRYDQMLRGEETITAAMLKNAITGLDQSASTLLGVCDRFIEDYTDLLRTKQCCRETYLRYLLTRNRLEEFLHNRYRIPDIPVKEIQPRFAAEFDRWLRITYQLTNSHRSAVARNRSRHQGTADAFGRTDRPAFTRWTRCCGNCRSGCGLCICPYREAEDDRRDGRERLARRTRTQTP